MKEKVGARHDLIYLGDSLKLAPARYDDLILVDAAQTTAGDRSVLVVSTQTGRL